MTSLRHNGPDPDASGTDRALDAARAAILAVGWKRTTLTDVARRAGVSRMTLYRRWPDMQTLLADLMTREWSVVVEDPADMGLTEGASTLDRIVGGIGATVVALRENDLFRKIVEIDPELLLPYLLDRRGRTQDRILALVETALAEGQRSGDVRPGDPGLMARTLLLATHGFVLSAHTMSDPAGEDPASGMDVDPGLDVELRNLVQRYLAP
ncbi:MAG TPA: TetR/AcrR family transcriptional regulator [Nocardioides sp.]|uniref:TetR/AcrR family transcriptional regulator n=1 Tax=Nocardioides sp. TaxID=35761 RepID=UPI002D7F9EE8|nr:TetR/AcrR family transcriptional regulator [Nocardioides sp.]HET6651836.1 TetR/AcrR family transcriptional regulator [Nocardioides sp.]